MQKLLDIDTTKLFFGPAFQQRNGLKIVPMSIVDGRFDYDSYLRFQVGNNQTDMVHSQYGMSTPMPGSNPDRRNMDLSVSDEMIAKIRELEAKVVEHFSANSPEIFKSPTLNRELSSILKTTPTGATVMKVKVAVAGDRKCAVRVLESPTTCVLKDADALGRNIDLLGIVDSPGVWYDNSRFGVSLTMQSALVRPPAGGGGSIRGLDAFNLEPGLAEVPDSM